MSQEVFIKEYQDKELPAELFHYTSCDTLLTGILNSGTLRLSPYGRLNDPRESLDWPYYIVDVGIDYSESDLSQPLLAATSADFGIVPSFVQEMANTMRQEHLKIVCFSTNKSDEVSIESHDPLKWDLSGCSKPRMWAQYGGNYRGACLVFDGQAIQSKLWELSSDMNPPMRNAVNYVSASELVFPFDVYSINATIPEGKLEEELIRGFYRWQDILFFTKHTDWIGESEFRILLYEPEQEYFSFDLKSILKAVIVGDKMPKIYQELVKRKCDDFKCKFGRISWVNHLFELDME